LQASILGLGEWFPDRVRSNQEWPAEFTAARETKTGRELVDIPCADVDECDRLVGRYLAAEANDPFMGTTARRVADPTTSAWQAESFAAARALAEAGVEARDVDAVLSWSVVPDRISPASANRVAHALGATRAWATGIDAACASAIAQLLLATSLVRSGQARFVLLTQSHLITRAFPFAHPASPNVGDGATAVVVGGPGGHAIGPIHAVTDGAYCDAVTWRRSEDDPPWWQAGGGFFLGSRDRAGAHHLTSQTVRIAAETVRELAQKADVPVCSIAAIAAVQPRRWVPPAIAEVLGLPRGRAPQTFDHYAHLGGCGVIANLLEARRSGLLDAGSLVALYAQGAGFTRAAALVRWA
jgi:3-oxoacyl-[acyl-carrier-protein] synthase III